MISPHKSAKTQNALLQRVQRYAQASTIFRTVEAGADSATNTISKPAQAPTKAVLLSAPSSLAMGRTVNAEGMGGMPLTSEAFPAALPSAPLSNIDPVAAALDHVTQMQRSPLPQPYQSIQPTPMQPAAAMPTPPQRPFSQQPAAPQPAAPQPAAPQSVAPQPPTPAPSALKSEGNLEGEWDRLQRIFKSHEVKKSSGATSQPTAPSQAVQRTEMEETAVSPTPASPPSNQPDTVQRAIHAAESTAESAASPTPARQAPLESVWPVQQTVVQPASSEPLVMRQPEAPIATEPAQPPEQIETIRSKLGGVSSSRQTDSSIELHLPRRPRPDVVQAKPQAEDPNKAFWNRLRKVEGKQPKSVQRTVETEIGPLPADMWEILGEPPPGEMPPGAAQPPTTSAAPDIQKQAAQPDAFPTSPAAPQTGETAVASFLAQASAVDADPSAQPSIDTIQRAIAAAEAPNPETQTADSEQLTVNSEQLTVDSERFTETASTAAEAPAPVAPGVQRTVENPAEYTTPPVPHGEAWTDNTPSPVEIEKSLPAANDAPDAVQRAIAAAEEKSTPRSQTPQAERTAVSTPMVSREPLTVSREPLTVSREPLTVNSEPLTVNSEQLTEAASAEPAAIQRAIAAAEMPMSAASAAKSAAAKTTLPAVMPEPKLPTSVSLESGSLQKSAATAPAVFRPAVSPTVDLNAETGPLPALPEVEETAVPTPPVTSEQLTVSSEQLTVNSEPLTAAASAAPEVIQRAIAAAEAASVQETPAPQAGPTAQAEQTAVSTPPVTSTAPDTVQRAIAAAEAAPVQAAMVDREQLTVNREPLTEAASTAPEDIQRAIAAAETAPIPETAAPPAKSMAVFAPSYAPTPTSAVQRAIAAAEAAPAAAHAISHSQPQTAVATPPALFQELQANEWQVKQETAVSQPAVAPAVAPAYSPTLMRALAAAEKSTASPVQNRYQWPDIKPASISTSRPAPTSAPPAAENIQRAEITAPDSTYQHLEAEPAAQTEQPPVNIDQLANEVYSQLKKRLAVEWERGRGKR